MASAAGKKKQKMKGKTLNLNEFLADENGQASGPGQSYVLANKPVNWADEVESEEVDADVMPYGYGAPLRNVNRASLPTAPRAARGPDVDMDKIPSRPPFTAFLGNLPYDISREDIEQFFRQLRVSNIRLPNDKGRMKGFGYAEFEDRQSLVDALTLNDTQMRGRKIRVDLAEQSQPGNDSGFGGERRGDDGEDRTLGDWRRRDDKPFDDRGSRDDSRGGGGFDRFERREDDRYGDRNRGYGDRDRGFSDRDRGRDFGDRDRGYGGDRDRGFGGDRNRGYGDRDRDRGYGDRDRDRGYGGDRDRDRDRGYGGDRDRGYDRYGGDRDRGRFGGDRDRDRGRYGGDRYDDRGGRFGGDRGGDRYGGDRGGDRFGDRRGYDDDRRSFGTGFRDRDRNGYRDDRYGGPRDRPDDRYSRDETDARGPPRGPEDQGEQDPSSPGDPDLPADGSSPGSPQDGPGESAGGGRRRLNLKPRSKPIEQVGATEQSSSIFGGAKPVDTAAKEREIEDRLRKQQEQEFERQEQEKEKRDEMERRRTSSSTSDKSKPRRGSDASLESERTTRRERKSSSSSGKGIRTVAPPPGAGSARVRHDSQMSDSEEVFEEDKPAVKTPPPRKEEAPPKLVPAPVPEENIWEKRKTSQHSHKEPSGPPPKKTEDQSSHQESRGSSTSQPQKSPQPAPAPKENAWSKGKPVDLVPAEPPRENIWAKRKQEAEKERKRQESMSSTHSQEAVSGNELEGDRTDSDHRTSTEHSPSERISQPRPRKSEEDTEGSFSGGHWGKKRGGGTGGPAGRGRGGERGRGRGERGRGRGDRSSRGGARGSSSREEKPLPKSIDEMPKYEEPKKKDWSDHNKFAGLLDDEGDEDQYSDD